MSNAQKLKPGDVVVFLKKLFEPPHTPYFDGYNGHVFEVVQLHHEDTHVELRCIDDASVVVNGYVSPHDLERARIDTHEVLRKRFH
jgi:hypothetical protein